MFWLLVSAGLTLFVYLAMVKPFNYWSSKGVPQVKFWITWRESLLGLIQYRSVGEIARMVYDDCPGTRYSGMYQFYKAALVVKDPDLVKQITVKGFDHFVDRYEVVSSENEPIWEKNLLFLKGEKWRDMRATLSPVFTSSKMRIMFDLISESAQQFVGYFQDQKKETVVVEMKDIFTRFANDVIASSAFGVTCDSLKHPSNEFYLMGKRITTFGSFLRTLQVVFIMIAPKTAKALGLRLFEKDVIDFFTKLVKENIAIREREGIFRPDLIQLLMEAREGKENSQKPIDGSVAEGFAAAEEASVGKDKKQRKPPLADEDIIAQALLFFFAGFDNVATLSSFMAYELALHPNVQQRLQKEIKDTLNNCQGSVTYEALSKMKYMDMVVSEVLRKWPPTVFMDRVCVKPYTISPVRDEETAVHFKKGDVLWIPVFGIHRDPEHFRDPDHFNPERFGDENKRNIAPYTYVPFGSGPRSCIANRFALMEVKLLFIHLLSKFDIEVVERTPIPIKLAKYVGFQLVPEGGFWLGLKSMTKDC